MYIGIKNNKVVFYSEQPINEEICVVDEVKKTDDKYMLSEDGTEYIPYDEEVVSKRKTKEQVANKENEYAMNRWQREIILAENSGASDYIRQKAQEIEVLAKKIRA